jgi:Raf kinase inhibitor-like YbhB/YbcL family protein
MSLISNFSIRSTAFREGDIIPVAYTCDHEDKNGISPPLEWKNAPSRTKSFVLIMDDPDVPHEPGTPARVWYHWLIFDIPATTTKLAKDLKAVPQGAKLGKNSWGLLAYGGPCPPDREHRYFFKIYALDSELSLEEGASRQEIEKAMPRTHIERISVSSSL